jgi:hypothetical protein
MVAPPVRMLATQIEQGNPNYPRFDPRVLFTAIAGPVAQRIVVVATARTAHHSASPRQSQTRTRANCDFSQARS